MSRQRIDDLFNLVDDDDIDHDQYHIDIALLPSEEDSSDGDSLYDSNEETLSSELPAGSYEHVRSFYTSTQKLLEPNHVYDWQNNAYNDSSVESTNDYTSCFNNNSILSLYNKNSLELFELFFSSALKNHIIEATSENNFELSIIDLERFLVIIMITIFNSRKSQRDYWSNSRLLQCSVIKELMTRDKFLKIKRFIRFYKLEDKDENDKVWKIRYLYDLFRENCMQFRFFDYTLSIDEMMVKYFGKFSIKQCIRNKPIRFGIKLWALCSSDGYLYDLDIYTGASGTDARNPLVSVCLGSKVVIKLLQDLLRTTQKEELIKYHVYFDNFFSSPDLMIHLKKNGLSTTGTVRQNRVKTKIDMPKKSKRGTTISVHETNSNLNYITVMDSKPVSILSTYGDEPKVEMQRWHEKSKTSILFPYAFSMYNKNMGGVDLHDQYCNALMPSIRSKKWTWCLFLRLIQASLANATVIYNKLHTNDKKGSKDVVKEVCEYYIEKFSYTHRSRRQSTSSLPDEHVMKIGMRKKCNMPMCSVRTQKFCPKCKKYLCKNHENDHS